MVGSEIVLASADAPDAPFRFEKVIASDHLPQEKLPPPWAEKERPGQ